jgi:hypothetical protein
LLDLTLFPFLKRHPRSELLFKDGKATVLSRVKRFEFGAGNELHQALLNGENYRQKAVVECFR